MPAPKYVLLDDTAKKRGEGTAAQSSAGVADADRIVSTGPDGLIDPSFLGTSPKTIREASENLDAGDLVSFFDDGGTPKVRKADASTSATEANGFVVNNFLATEQADVFTTGTITGLTGFVTGETLYLDTTAGAFTNTPASGTGELWQEVGYAISATEACIVIQAAICRA